SKPCIFIGPRPVGAKHSDRKSTVSPIGYCPNASPVLFQQTLFVHYLAITAFLDCLNRIDYCCCCAK
ncbi:MAG: hypothetical protein EWV55_00310, partial [Microcystis viridis Mv_BB_P_19951000_S69]